MKRLALIACLLPALPAAAQQRQLEQADSLLVAGQFDQARTVLADWQRTNPPGTQVDPAARARALYLNARLTSDATKALETYLSLALSYPTSREAPDALLRLGQGFLAAGDPGRAQTYLARLVNDHPSAPNRAHGYLWLARAQAAAGNTIAACATAKAGLAAGSATSEVTTLAQEEERAACSGTARVPALPPPIAEPVREPPVSRDMPARETTRTVPRNSSARYALQIGAFREVRTAIAMVSDLRRKGYDARVAYVGESSLARVRVGRFSNAAAAEAEARRLRNARISPIVVNDATRERSTR